MRRQSATKVPMTGLREVEQQQDAGARFPPPEVRVPSVAEVRQPYGKRRKPRNLIPESPASRGSALNGEVAA
jgi:hypothetical protein